ncbi:MAG: hypothetical protein QM740_20125 [Acidovorax sp.]
MHTSAIQFQASYPDMAGAIRNRSGRSGQAQDDDRHRQLRGAKEKIKELRAEMRDLRTKVAKLASINEVLLMDNRELRRRLARPEVVDLASRKRGG